MARPIRSGRREFGFTLIELMVSMAIVLVVISVAVANYQKALTRSKETVLRQNLSTLRHVIDEYSYDKQKAPQSLDDLVREGYLRQIPYDPITGSNTWETVMEDAAQSVNQSEPGIWDVKSRSEKTSLEGTPYNEW